MNTVAEFHELMIINESSYGSEKLDSSACVKASDLAFDMPSVASTTSSSSLDESLNSAKSYGMKRSVSFHENVEVREYSLSVGDHPMCGDGLPLSLGWSHAEPVFRHIDHSKTRRRHHKGPARLSLHERRRRLRVAGETEDDFTEQSRYQGTSLLSLLGTGLSSSWSSIVRYRSEVDNNYTNRNLAVPIEVLVGDASGEDLIDNALSDNEIW